MTSGSKKFFLGTDSAPHERGRKECACGCAGIFNAPVALSLYAKVFEEVGCFIVLCLSKTSADDALLHFQTEAVKLKFIFWSKYVSIRMFCDEIVSDFVK